MTTVQQFFVFKTNLAKLPIVPFFHLIVLSFVHILLLVQVIFHDHLILLVMSFPIPFLLMTVLILLFLPLTFQVYAPSYVAHFVIVFVLEMIDFVSVQLFLILPLYFFVLTSQFLLALIFSLNSNHNHRGMSLHRLFLNVKLYRQFCS